MASTAESALFRTVLSMTSPQTSMQPPAALMTAWVMFWLRDFSRPACVPQKPGVRQISRPQPGIGVKTQPLAGLQVSVVHTSLSLHGALGVKTQPVAGLQVSVVHALLSLQGALGVKTQPVAGLQVSVVHALLSLHGALGVKTQPVAGLQVSVVHASLSLQ